MKYLSRLTALLLAFVLLFSSSVGAFAESSLSDFTRSSYDKMVSAAKEAAEAEAAALAAASLETESELKPTTLTMEDGGFAFEISGDMPADAEMYVTTLDQDTVDYIQSNILCFPDELPGGLVAQAFDMGLVSNNEKWQPDTAVEVKISGLDIAEGSQVAVIHIPDVQPAMATFSLDSTESTESDSGIELISASTNTNGDVVFETTGFSIFYTITSGGTEKPEVGPIDGGTVVLKKGDSIRIRSDLKEKWPSFSNGGILGALYGVVLAVFGYSKNDLKWEHPANSTDSPFTCTPADEELTVVANNSGTITVRYGDYDRNGSNFYGEAINIVCLNVSDVTFNYNYPIGTDIEKAIETAEGGTFTFPEISDPELMFTAPEGYEFVGWSTDQYGKADAYPAGIVHNISEDTTYYAQWFNPNINDNVDAFYRLRLDGAIPYEPAHYDASLYTRDDALPGKIKQAIPINNNEALVAQNLIDPPTEQTIAGANLGIDISVADIFDDESQIVWYAVKWVPESLDHAGAHWHVDGVYKPSGTELVIYDANGGVNPPAAQAYEVGATVKVDFTHVPTRAGYVFSGWETTLNNQTVTYTTEGSFEMPDSPVILRAIWTASTETVYTVEHYWFMTDESDEKNKMYSLKDSQAFLGTTGATVTAEYIDYPGYAPYVEDGSLEINGEKITTVAKGEVAPDGSLVLKLHYRQATADLEVTKNVVSEEAESEYAGSTFKFKVEFWESYTDEETKTYDTSHAISYSGATGNRVTSIKNGETFILGVGEKATISKLPASTVYRITEVEMPAGFTLTTSTNTVSTVKKDNDQNKVTFTNNFVKPTADLTISKTVITSPGSAEPDANDEFTFTVKFGDGSDTTTSYTYTKSGDTEGASYQITSGGTLTLKAGQTATIEDIPIATKYEVTETGMDTGYAMTSSTGATGTILPVSPALPNGTVAAFTNTYTTGTLTISKTVDIAQGATIPTAHANDTFNFTVTLPNGTYNYTVNDAAAQTLTVTNGTDTLSLKHGETAVIAGIPVGAAYTVAEAENANYTTVVTGAESGNMTANGVAVAYTNTYKTGSLTIRQSKLKQTSGDDRESAIYTVTGNGQTWTVVVPGNSSVTLTNLPVGVEYTVTEQTGWTWRYGNASASQKATVTPTNDPTVEFEFSHDVTKWLGGDNYEINKFK